MDCMFRTGWYIQLNFIMTNLLRLTRGCRDLNSVNPGKGEPKMIIKNKISVIVPFVTTPLNGRFVVFSLNLLIGYFRSVKVIIVTKVAFIWRCVRKPSPTTCTLYNPRSQFNIFPLYVNYVTFILICENYRLGRHSESWCNILYLKGHFCRLKLFVKKLGHY